MKSHFRVPICLCMFGVLAVLPAASLAEIIRVDRDVSEGTHTGETWANAFKYLQDALAFAADPQNDVTEIWVAEGTYKPTEKSCTVETQATDCDGEDCVTGLCDWAEPRRQSFLITHALEIYGGFAGDEDCRDQRDHNGNPTILSGDLQEDDDPDECPPDPESALLDDNSCSVVRIANGLYEAPDDLILDGFTITSGNAAPLNDCWFDTWTGGGGIRMEGHSGVTILNCRVVCNTTSHSGGGIFGATEYPGDVYPASVRLARCVVADNSAPLADGWGGGKGGGIDLSKGYQQFWMYNSQIVGNVAEKQGGGISLNDSHSAGLDQIVNSLIAGNSIEAVSSSPQGGGLFANSADVAIINSTIAGNSAGSGNGGGIYWGSDGNDEQPPLLNNSIVWGNSAGDGYQIYVAGLSAATANYSDIANGEEEDIAGDDADNLELLNCIDAAPEFVEGEYRLDEDSPCLDHGDNSLIAADLLDLDDDDNTASQEVPFDLAGAPRRINDPATDAGSGTAPIVDMGAYERSAGGCPSGTLAAQTPPDGVVDARRPHPANNASTLEGIEELIVTAPSGAGDECFTLCETAEWTGGTPAANSIASISADGTTYTITLARPITPGAVTTLRYSGDPNTELEYTSHPANVNGDSMSSAIDILRLVDCVNGINPGTNCPWEEYSFDIDRDDDPNVPDMADVWMLIDLLNGVGFAVWYRTPLPSALACTGEGACPEGSTAGCKVIVHWNASPDPDPEVGDYAVDSATPPNVVLKRKVKGGQGVTLWQIGITCQGGTTGNLGTITTDWEEVENNYNVTVEVGTTPTTPCGNLGGMTINPHSASKWSNIELELTGALTGNVTCTASGGEGGRITGTVAGPAAGAQARTVGTGSPGSGLALESASAGASLTLIDSSSTASAGILLDEWLITGTLAGDLDVGMVWYASGQDSPKGAIHVDGTGESTGDITIGGIPPSEGLLGGKVLIDGDYSGVLTIAKMSTDGMDTPNTDPEVQIDGLLLSGSISITEDLVGTVEILGTGTSTGSITVGGDLAGDLVVTDSYSGDIAITGDLDGTLTIDGTFTGDVCAANIVPGEAFPAGLDIATWGTGATLCGAKYCTAQSACSYVGDGDWCTVDKCQEHACIEVCDSRPYGDVKINHVVNMDDITTVNAAYSGTYTNCGNGTKSGCDVWNNTTSGCSPQDELIHLDDILKVYAAFGGNFACTTPCDCGDSMMMGGEGEESAAAGPLDAAEQIIGYLADAVETEDMPEQAIWSTGDALAIWCQETMSSSEIEEVVVFAEAALEGAAAEMNVSILETLIDELK